MPDARRFLMLLLRRLSIEAMPELGVVAVASHPEDSFIVGFADDLNDALLADVDDAIAVEVARIEAKREYGPFHPRMLAVSRVVERRMTEVAKSDDHEWDVGWATQCLGADVVVVVGVPSRSMRDAPSALLGENTRTTFVEHVIQHFVRRVSEQLGTTKPLMHFQPQLSAPDLFRDAGESFTRQIMATLHDNPLFGLYGSNVFERMNQIAFQRYEGAEAVGTIVFARSDDKSLALSTKFVKPVWLSDPVWSRKTVELATPSLGVVSTDDRIFGLLPISAVEERFNVVLKRNHTWVLRQGTRDLLEVRFGAPSLPRARLTKERFTDSLRRIFGAGADSESLWSVVDQAMQQRHGTMIVISRLAQSEAQRLASQATPVEPRVLDRETTAAATGIDGAVLLDWAARCHAIGVILDGIASDKGSPSRGARFNSALRYVNSQGEAVLAVVVSEDGHVDVIPRLRPQLRRREFDALLDTALGRAQIANDAERFAACFRLLKYYHEYVPVEALDDVVTGAVGFGGLLESDERDEIFSVEFDKHDNDIVDE